MQCSLQRVTKAEVTHNHPGVPMSCEHIVHSQRLLNPDRKIMAHG